MQNQKNKKIPFLNCFVSRFFKKKVKKKEKMNKILDLISPRTKKKEVDDNDSYSDDDFEDGDEESPVKTSRTENTEADSILTTSVTPKTKEAGDDDLNDFLSQENCCCCW